jgi:diguanylate cyclase (GGDEF)-like protein
VDGVSDEEGKQSTEPSAKRQLRVSPRLGAFTPLAKLNRPRALIVGGALFVAIVSVDAMAPYQWSVVPLFLFPIILVAWNAGPVWGGVFAVAAGAADVLTGLVFGHPYSSPGFLIVASAIRTGVYLLVSLTLSTLMRRLYDQERAMSRTDFLTGLPNRFAFYDFVAREMDRQRRYGRPCSAIYLDCDNFKQVNDTMGHAAGDELLKTVAIAVEQSIRQSDLAARLGGDEFAILLPETEGQAALRVAQSLRKRLAKEMDSHGWPVTFSIGVAGFESFPESVDQLVELADRLMYQAKRGGKDRIAFEQRP